MDALRREVLELAERAAPLVVQLHDGSDVFLRDDDRGGDVRLVDFLDLARELVRVVHLEPVAVASLLHAVGDVRRGHEQVEVVFALEPLTDDVHVQQPQEAATESEPERVGGLGLPGQRGVIQRQLLEGVAQVWVVV